MRAAGGALTVSSEACSSLGSTRRKESKVTKVSKRVAVVTAASAALVLGGGAYALGGGGAPVWDDGHAVRPGSLDDGRALLPRTTVSLRQAVAAARAAQSGRLGQVDLTEREGRVYFVVDVGDREVSVDGVTGDVAGVAPQS
jgi:uncharacterized membrane protein YkoI